jgi:hypothetical protein
MKIGLHVVLAALVSFTRRPIEPEKSAPANNERQIMQVTDKMKSDGENCPKLVLRIIPLF